MHLQPQGFRSPSFRRNRGGALRALIFFLVAIIALGLIGAIASVAGLQFWGGRKSGVTSTVHFEVPRGASLQSIAEGLAEQGVLDHPSWFMIYAWLVGKHRSLQAGDYSLDLPLSPREVIDRLQSGSFERRITIPEGWTKRQIAEMLVREGWIAEPGIWLDLVARPFQGEATGIASPGGSEGFCFPDTYFLEEGTKAEEIHHRMLQQFDRVWRELNPEDREARSAKLTPLEVITLASMIEREARSVEEMPAIASVYLNRLKIRMKLQCCATVHYALGEVWDRALRLDDLKIESPYNTYRHFGLPPGPIGNPGREAIAAVLRPEASDYLYYVYKGDGTHAFTKTYREHMAAARKYLHVDPNAALMKGRENGAASRAE